MAFTEVEKAEYGKQVAEYIERRRPAVEIRDRVDLAFRIERQSIIIFEIRPFFLDRNRKTESPIAKTTYIRKQNLWQVYWMKRDLKWHRYSVKPKVRTLEKFLELIDEDASGCFWG